MASKTDVFAAVRRVLSECSGDDHQLDAWLARAVKKLPPLRACEFFVAHSTGFLAGVTLASGSRDRRAHRANARSGAALALCALAEKKKAAALEDYVVMIHAALEASGKAPDLQVCKNSGGR